MVTETNGPTSWQIMVSRLLYAFVNIGLGSSYIIQRPLVKPPARAFLEGLPIPFWVYGVLFCLAGLVIVFHSLRDSAKGIFMIFQAVAVVWFLFSAGFLEPVFTDPLHIPWAGFVVFFFIGGVHQAAALIEAHRV